MVDTVLVGSVVAFLAAMAWGTKNDTEPPPTPEMRLQEAVDRYGERVRECGLPPAVPTNDRWQICVNRFVPGSPDGDPADLGEEMRNGSGNR